MLTDREIGAPTPKMKMFKVGDRDGMYLAALPTGTRAFRYDYRINGRRNVECGISPSRQRDGSGRQGEQQTHGADDDR
ncbi:Arm DNA-binding domain-containing protein [Paralcaligenes sp. KSB-10]|uniref:Arm DNA-binding domain-containing protein n=1 Tax=Paralcaligenes sp. KSB-10 TaxID=2901142 RepID=UPI00351CEFCF